MEVCAGPRASTTTYPGYPHLDHLLHLPHLETLQIGFVLIVTLRGNCRIGQSSLYGRRPGNWRAVFGREIKTHVHVMPKLHQFRFWGVPSPRHVSVHFQPSCTVTHLRNFMTATEDLRPQVSSSYSLAAWLPCLHMPLWGPHHLSSTLILHALTSTGRYLLWHKSSMFSVQYSPRS